VYIRRHVAYARVRSAVSGVRRNRKLKAAVSRPACPAVLLREKAVAGGRTGGKRAPAAKAARQ